MKQLFEFDEHIGDWRVLVQDRDIQNGAIQSRHIAPEAVTTDKIADNAIEGRMIKNNTVDGRCIANDAIESRHIVEKSIKGDEVTPNGVKEGNLADNAVSTRTIQDGAVIPAKLDPDLVNVIYSAGEHGYKMSNEFGNCALIGISQKTLTSAFNRVWQKLEDITGEVLQGFSIVITPEYYIGETGADVHITANTVDANGIFENIAFYANGQLIARAENVDSFEYDTHIDETTVITCTAKIMGIEYTRQGIITHYSSFFLGSGSTYADLLDNGRFLPQYAIPITNGMRGAYDVSVAEGRRIIVVVGDSLSEGFIRADLNGVEIQFTESACTDADGKTYKVFTSEPWSAGDYNIDING